MTLAQHRLQHRRRGVALLLSLAILAVLAILATTFTRLMIMERHAATNYVASSRAEALATAGLDYALGQLRLLARNQHWSWFSEGFGTTSTGTEDKPIPAQRWVYKMRVVDGAPFNFYEDSGAGLPLEFASYPPGIKSGSGPHIYGGPSFYKGNTAVDDATDVILGTYPATEVAEYEVYSAAIAKTGKGRPISGWIGNSFVVGTEADGKERPDGPQSKYVAGTYENWGDTFSLKVLDCSSMVNVNMDTFTIASFLNLLGEEVDLFFRERFSKDGSVVTRSTDELKQMGYRYKGLYIVSDSTVTGAGGLGSWLISRRDLKPGKVFQSKEEILSEMRDLLGTATITVDGTPLRGDQVAREDYEKLKDFITCYGFRDRTVIEPGNLMTNQLYVNYDPTAPHREARTPINMNTVSNPVLTAWLRGISYNKYDESDLAVGVDTSSLVGFDAKFGADRLRKLAFTFRRMTYFTPILAWKGLQSRLREHLYPLAPASPSTDLPIESMAGDVTANKSLRDAFTAEMDSCGFDVYDVDAWLAMADPNTTLNKFNPDSIVRRRVDKYDLETWTTEMCFNSMGYYEIYSLGTITNNGGAVIADRKLRGVYQIFDMVYKTTQHDFELDRMKVGRDITLNTDIDLFVGDWWGVITLPEYRSKFLEYSATDYDSTDPKTYGYVALYDGDLCFNVLDLKTFYDDDFGNGFTYPLFKNPEADKDELDGIRPVGAASKYIRSPASFTSGSSVVSVSERKRMAVPTATTPKLEYKRVSGGGASALTRFNSGSDAFPMGFYSDHLRERALAFDATVVTGGENGAVQFWVQPRFETAVDRESWFYWEDEFAQKIWVYREGRVIKFMFSIGTVDSGILSYDTTLTDDPTLGNVQWAAGTWHHIHVDWGRTGRIFVDGEEATSGGHTPESYEPEYPPPKARHMTFGGWPPKTAEAMRTFLANPTKYKSAIEWVEQHIPQIDNRYTFSKSGVEMWLGYGDNAKDPAIATAKDLFANATIDNVYITNWRIYDSEDLSQKMGTDIPFRFFPKSYHDVSRYYWQDISSAFSSYGRDIELGTIAWTNWHDKLSFVRVYLQIDDYDAQEAVAG